MKSMSLSRIFCCSSKSLFSKSAQFSLCHVLLGQFSLVGGNGHLTDNSAGALSTTSRRSERVRQYEELHTSRDFLSNPRDACVYQSAAATEF